MEAIALNLDGPPLVSPASGYILMVRFKLKDRSEFDTVFCDYGILNGRALTLMGCRSKTFVVGYMPCDYALKVGNLTLQLEHVMDVFQLPTPHWYHRLEEDARALTCSERIALDVGVLDVFAELTGK